MGTIQILPRSLAERNIYESECDSFPSLAYLNLELDSYHSLFRLDSLAHRQRETD